MKHTSRGAEGKQEWGPQTWPLGLLFSGPLHAKTLRPYGGMQELSGHSLKTQRVLCNLTGSSVFTELETFSLFLNLFKKDKANFLKNVNIWQFQVADCLV